MKTGPRHLKTAISWLVAYIMLVTTGVAQAELRYIKLANDTQRTLLWCAVILALGMIVSAVILRKPK